MSKFFGEGNASSDSDDNDHQDENSNKKEVPNYHYDDFQDRGDQRKRVILTEKEKKWGHMKKTINVINTAVNNQDFDKVWENFQELLASIEKAEKIIDKQGHPSFFLRFLIKINEEITSLSTQDKQKLNKNSSKAYNTMKQKLKNKVMPTYEPAITKFQEEGGQQSSDEEFKQQQQSSSESEQGDRLLLKSPDPMVRRRFFLKRKVIEIIDKKKEKEGAKELLNEELDKPKDENDKLKDEEKKKKKFNYVQKQKKKSKQGASSKQAQAEIQKMVKNFHKLKTQQDREDYLSILNDIKDSSSKYKDFEKLSIRLVDIPMRIQVSRQMKLTHFMRQHWVDMFTHVEECFEILRESEEQDLLQNILTFNEDEIAQKVDATEESVYSSIKSFIMILQSELRKAFMFVDNSDVEYTERLQDLIQLVDFMYRISRELSVKDGLQRSSAEIAFKVIQNMYFMSSAYIERIKKDNHGKALTFVQLEDQQTLQNYAGPVLRMETEDNVTKTILYLVYNHAINYRTKAKDLLSMSNVPSTISRCDYYTQALYNRAIVKIGVCAFRNGNLFEVQQYLSEVCGYAKNKEQVKDVIKEFLAQGARTNIDLPKNKILPYYLHLNCELIQTIELISSMILEVPYMLNEGGRITSKTFRKLISDYERLYFVAQPIRSKDLVYAASNYLRSANWRECYERLMEIGVWREMYDMDTVRQNLLKNIKEQSLKCYLVGNRKCFTSISMQGLAEKFELDLTNVKRLVCKWINNRDLKGSITSDGYLQIVQKKTSDMQKVSEELFRKLEEVMKTNQTIMENRLGTVIEEQQHEKDNKFHRKTNYAMTQKLKANLSKRS